MSKGKLVLITGGARAGKSTYAEKLAASWGERVLYLATAEVRDEAMRLRVEAHRQARPAQWQTLEAPQEVAEALGAAGVEPLQVVLLDCLTMLCSNVLLRHAGDDPQADGSYEAAREAMSEELAALLAWHEGAGAHLIVVSNEVGMGIVPENPLARAYRDLLGFCNRRLAEVADEVYLLVAGLPLPVKALSGAADKGAER